MDEIINFKHDIIYTLNNRTQYSSYDYYNLKYPDIYHSTKNFYPISLYNLDNRFYEYPKVNQVLKKGLFLNIEKLNMDYYHKIRGYSSYGAYYWGNFSAFTVQKSFTPLIMLCFRPSKRIYTDKVFYEKDFKFFINSEIFANTDYKKLVTYFQKVVIPLCTMHKIQIVMGNTKDFEDMFIHTVSDINMTEKEVLDEVLNEL